MSPFTLRRVVYIGGINNAPTAKAEVSKSLAVVGEVLNFDGRQSFDEDGDRLSYRWDFDDGTFGSGRETSHVYTTKGTYTVSLTVQDGNGGQSRDHFVLSVGIPPKVHIASPVEGATFSVGEQLGLTGESMDSNGQLLPASSLTWEVRLHHATHWHPFLSPTNGEHVKLFPAPSPEDLLAATNSYLEVRLTATDFDGLSTTQSRKVKPKAIWIDFETNPLGADLSVDDFRIKTPHRLLSWENHNLKVLAPSDSKRTFVRWSDGGEQGHTIVVKKREGEDAIKFVATYHDVTYWESVLRFLKYMTSSSAAEKESHLRSSS